MATPASFWKKFGPMIPPDQNPHQTVTFSGYIWSWYLAWIGIVPNSTILLVHVSIQKWASSLKMIYLAKFGLTSNCQNPISEHTTLSMVVYLKFLDQLNFIGVQTQVPTQNLPSWSRRKQVLVNVEKLTASGFPVHSHAQQRCFQQTLRFGDVLVLADYLSNRLTWIWPPNVE